MLPPLLQVALQPLQIFCCKTEPQLVLHNALQGLSKAPIVQAFGLVSQGYHRSGRCSLLGVSACQAAIPPFTGTCSRFAAFVERGRYTQGLENLATTHSKASRWEQLHVVDSLGDGGEIRSPGIRRT